MLSSIRCLYDTCNGLQKYFDNFEVENEVSVNFFVSIWWRHLTLKLRTKPINWGLRTRVNLQFFVRISC